MARLKNTYRAEGLLNTSLLQKIRIVVPDDGPRKVGWNTGHLKLKFQSKFSLIHTARSGGHV
jgi:hypothetical protein